MEHAPNRALHWLFGPMCRFLLHDVASSGDTATYKQQEHTMAEGNAWYSNGVYRTS